MNKIITIAKKELQAHLNNPASYIFILAFIWLWEFLFFRQVFLIGEVSLIGFFAYLPWLFMIIIPALTMSSFSEEKSEGTLEFLLTRSLSFRELLIGKFLGLFFLIALSLLIIIFPLALSFNHFGALDWGKVWSQYLASFFLASVFISLGLLFSSFFASQISAFILSAVSSFLLIIVGTEFFSSRFPWEISAFLEQLSAVNHFNSMTRGVIDARDVWYFISLTAVFLAFTYLNLVKTKFGNRRSVYRQYQLASLILSGIFVLSNIAGSQIPGRLDLTQEKIYSLSSATKNIVSQLPDLVNISFYVSEKLPAQFQPIAREVKDILTDYQKISHNKIKLNFKNPTPGSEAASEALSLGIQPVRFNVVSREELQVKEGYLGLAITYGGQDEIIPFIDNINDLEYQLSSLIRKLTQEKKPKIGFITGHGEKSLYSDYNLLNQEIRKQFEIVEINAQAEESSEKTKNSSKKEKTETVKKITIPEDVKTLIIAGPTENYSEEEKKILSDFISQGGSIFFLAEGVQITPQLFSASVNESNLADFIKGETGVEVEKKLVFDFRSNESVGFSDNGGINYVLPYPFWLRSLNVNKDFPANLKIEDLVLPWASPLKADEETLKEKKWNKFELFATSDFAGAQQSDFNISPDQKLSSQNLEKKTLAVALEHAANRARLIITGDADFPADQNIRNNLANFSFFIQALSWLSQEEALSQLKVKNTIERRFVFKSPAEPHLIKFGNMGLALALIGSYGSLRLWRRRKMKERKYFS